MAEYRDKGRSRSRNPDDDDRESRPPKRRRFGGFGERRPDTFLPQRVQRPGHRLPETPPDTGAPRGIAARRPPTATARIQPPAPTTGGSIGSSSEVQRALRDQAETRAYSSGVRGGTRDPLRVLPGSMQLLDFLPQLQAAATPAMADMGEGIPPIHPLGTSLDEIVIPPPILSRHAMTGSRIPYTSRTAPY